MIRAFSILALWLATSFTARAAQIELPEWEKSDRDHYTLGGGLWPTGSVPRPFR